MYDLQQQKIRDEGNQEKSVYFFFHDFGKLLWFFKIKNKTKTVVSLAFLLFQTIFIIST